MKKTLLSVAVASASVLAAAQATAADVKVYGKANVSYQYEHERSKNDDVVTADDERFALASNASRIGFKGKSEINESTNVIYKLEYQTAMDDGDEGGKTFKQRNIFVGVKGDFGTVMAGMHDSPLKMIGKPVDIFSDLAYSDIKNITKRGENRVKNMIMYRSPSLGGFTVDAQFAPGEDMTDATGAQNQAADHISIAAKFKTDAFSVALAVDNDDPKAYNNIRFVAAGKAGPVAISGLLQTSEPNGENASNKSIDSFIVTGAFKIAKPVKLKLSLGTSTESKDNTEDKTRTSLIFGADYKLAKKTKVYGFMASHTEEQGDKEKHKTAVGVGLEHKF